MGCISMNMEWFCVIQVHQGDSTWHCCLYYIFQGFLAFWCPVENDFGTAQRSEWRHSVSTLWPEVKIVVAQPNEFCNSLLFVGSAIACIAAIFLILVGLQFELGCSPNTLFHKPQTCSWVHYTAVLLTWGRQRLAQALSYDLKKSSLSGQGHHPDKTAQKGGHQEVPAFLLEIHLEQWRFPLAGINIYTFPREQQMLCTLKRTRQPVLISKEDIPFSSVDIFGMGYGCLSSCVFNLLKSVRNQTVNYFLGIYPWGIKIWCNDSNVHQPVDFSFNSGNTNMRNAEWLGCKGLSILRN